MRVYIDLDENIDNVKELHAYIVTRDDKHIVVGGDIKLWDTEKIGHWGKDGECPFCGYFRKWKDDNFCGNCGAKMEV